MSYLLYDPDSADSPEKQLLRRTFLTVADRKLIVLLLDRNTQAEIATELGCTRQTVGIRLQALRIKLLKHGYGNDYSTKSKPNNKIDQPEDTSYNVGSEDGGRGEEIGGDR